MSTPDQTWDPNWLLLFGAWVVVTVSALSSLFFSEVMSLPPCSLCWYQRTLMFPLVVVLLVGLLPFDPRAGRYGAPLAAVGWIIAAYHVLLTMGIVPERIAPCSQGVSCADVDFALFGVFSIPMLSLMSFSMVLGLLIPLVVRQNK